MSSAIDSAGAAPTIGRMRDPVPLRPEPPPATGAKRLFLLALGWICVGLGMIGIVVPGLPTTPFMLVALWAFAQGSRRFHDWLWHHRYFGPPLQDWYQRRIIPRRAKITALGMMGLSLAIAIFVLEAPWLGVGAMTAAMAIGAGYILSCPSESG